MTEKIIYWVLNLILTLPWILIGLVFHEFCHGYISYRLGDPTPKSEGRLSLNPLVHLEPVGFLLLLFAKFGWAKPVQINPGYYKKPDEGIFLVGLAGPVANLILVIIITLVFKLLNNINVPVIYLFFLKIGLQINLVLMLFNLIPIPPLDGSRVFRYFLRGRLRYYYDGLERFGFYILLAILIPDLAFSNGLITNLLFPVLNFIEKILVG